MADLSAALSDDQREGGDVVVTLAAGATGDAVLDALGQEVNAGAGDAGLVRRDGRQGRGGERALVDVVDADDRDVTRDFEPCLAQGTQRPDGKEVVEAEQRVRAW